MRGIWNGWESRGRGLSSFAARYAEPLLLGAPLFGVVLQARDSYEAAWAVIAALSAVVALLMALAGGAIQRECERARGGA